MTIRAAQLAAEETLLKSGITDMPVDLRLIAATLGLKILEQDLGPETSGLLVRTPRGTHICVAIGHPNTRKRFTIAHEIGHHVLGHQFEPGAHVHVDRGNYISQRSGRAAAGVDAKEVEANQFAAHLLMPTDKVRAKAKQLPRALFDLDVEALAREFEVSEQAMTIRLTTLRLL